MSTPVDQRVAPPVAASAGPNAAPAAGRVRRGASGRAVLVRRVVGIGVVVLLLGWALAHAVSGDAPVLNRAGLPLLGDLLGRALRPALGVEFLARVLDATLVTVAFAALGTLGALGIGLVGGLVLSRVAGGDRPSVLVRLARLPFRALLVLTRSIHELVWALLFVSVLGLDPLVAVLAIAVPFGAQTAKIFAEIFDGVPPGPLRALRRGGARPVSAWIYGLLPGAAPLLAAYGFYRFECAVRSAVLLGVVGVGGLGEALVVSLSSRNWDEVWTLIGAVVLLSAAVDAWSARFRAGQTIASCHDGSAGREHARLADGVRRPRRTRPGWSRVAVATAAVVVGGGVLAWWSAGVSLAGLTTERTRVLTGRLLDDLWPPALPPGGWPVLGEAMLDTIAVAVLAMAVAVCVTLALGPAASWRAGASGVRPRLGAAPRRAGWWLARLVLLVLRSVPPTVWAVLALLVLFPGVLPGALALGLYTGGILGRLTAEAWELVDTRPREALERAGVPSPVAAVAAVLPPSAAQLLTYTLYRFEICVRDTAVVGVVGAAGLGRLLGENLAVFRFPAVTTLVAASVLVSAGTELVSHWARRSRANG